MPQVEVTTTEAPANVRASNGKAPAAKRAAKKVAKKAVAAKPAKEAKEAKKATVRERALTALAKRDMTASQVQEAIGLGHGLKPTLDQEVERKHLSVTGVSDDESGKGTVYHLTAAGRKALESGTVNPKRGE